MWLTVATNSEARTEPRPISANGAWASISQGSQRTSRASSSRSTPRTSPPARRPAGGGTSAVSPRDGASAAPGRDSARSGRISSAMCRAKAAGLSWSKRAGALTRVPQRALTPATNSTAWSEPSPRKRKDRRGSIFPGSSISTPASTATTSARGSAAGAGAKGWRSLDMGLLQEGSSGRGTRGLVRCRGRGRRVRDRPGCRRQPTRTARSAPGTVTAAPWAPAASGPAISTERCSRRSAAEGSRPSSRTRARRRRW